MSNVYYNPEEFGLTPIGDVDFSDGCYVFDLTAVWRDAKGDLLWADDSGCSCPSPFESMRLRDLTRGTFFDLAEHLNKRAENADTGEENRAKAAVVELLARLR